MVLGQLVVVILGVDSDARIRGVNDDVDPAFVVVDANNDSEDRAIGALEAEEPGGSAANNAEAVPGLRYGPGGVATEEGLLDEREGITGVVDDTEVDGVRHSGGMTS